MERCQLILGDCLEKLKEIPHNSVDLVITSPPYNLQMEYEKKLTEEQYLSFIENCLKEIYKVLKIGGRICWNVPNQVRVGRDGNLWSPLIETALLMKRCNLSFFDFLMWNQKFSDNATAWGSWCSPSSPFIRHQLEAIIVFFKKKWNSQKSGGEENER